MAQDKINFEIQKFLKLVSKLDPISFVGVARLLNISIYEEVSKDEKVEENVEVTQNAADASETETPKDERIPRPFEQILSDMVTHFTNLSGRGRKNLLLIIENSLKRGGKKHVHKARKRH